MLLGVAPWWTRTRTPGTHATGRFLVSRASTARAAPGVPRLATIRCQDPAHHCSKRTNRECFRFRPYRSLLYSDDWESPSSQISPEQRPSFAVPITCSADARRPVAQPVNRHWMAPGGVSCPLVHTTCRPTRPEPTISPEKISGSAEATLQPCNCSAPLDWLEPTEKLHKHTVTDKAPEFCCVAASCVALALRFALHRARSRFL